MRISFILFFIVLNFCFTSSVIAKTNLIRVGYASPDSVGGIVFYAYTTSPNASMEYGLETENPISGTTSLRIDVTNPGINANYYWGLQMRIDGAILKSINFKKDYTYKLSYKVKSSVPTSFVMIKQRDGSGGSNNEIFTDNLIGNGMVETKTFITKPVVDNTNNILFGWCLGNPGVVCSYIFDDITIEEYSNISALNNVGLFDFNAFCDSGRLTIQSEREGEFEVFNSVGQLILTNKVEANTLNSFNINKNNKLLIIRIKNLDGDIVTRKLIQTNN